MRTLSKPFLFALPLLFPLLFASGCNEEEMRQMQEQMKRGNAVTVEALTKQMETMWAVLGKAREGEERAHILAFSALAALPFVFLLGVGMGSAAKREALAGHPNREHWDELE
jgi:hypothetical protein